MLVEQGARAKTLCNGNGKRTWKSNERGSISSIAMHNLGFYMNIIQINMLANYIVWYLSCL